MLWGWFMIQLNRLTAVNGLVIFESQTDNPHPTPLVGRKTCRTHGGWGANHSLWEAEVKWDTSSWQQTYLEYEWLSEN